ncbi:hypothetical protein [Embleya scabrispora]|uniref:hypothetical protein n=1 Tax=Embleya scabrispora TaxID=159449 RepID=UPI00035EF3C6|nr:hypothetical protein [Embleya scabrispora]MYS86516.1 hypothetical protein [Streptomyces sp. SID5474]
MWLTLVKIEPALPGKARERPHPVAELRGTHEAHGEDYRALCDIAEGRAEVEEGTAEWMSVYPALARATGNGCAAVEASDPGGGAAFVLTADEVARVATGLADEGWTGFLEIARFYVAAAAEGRAVVGEVN